MCVVAFVCVCLARVPCPREQRHLINYIAESDSTGITVFTDLLETALRDDFHNYRRKMNKFWMCGVNYPTDCQTLGDEEASLKVGGGWWCKLNNAVG